MEGPQLMLFLSETHAELLAAFRVSNANRDVTASILITILIMLILTKEHLENNIGVDICWPPL
jgi:hypothetical protein